MCYKRESILFEIDSLHFYTINRLLMVALLYHPILTSIILRLLNGEIYNCKNRLPYQLRTELFMIGIRKDTQKYNKT